MPNGIFWRDECQHVLEVDEDALRGLGAQVDDAGGVLDRAHEGLEHQVELARLGELALPHSPGALLGFSGHCASAMWSARKRCLALLAVDQRVGEAGDVARGLPDARVHEDRAVDADDVVARLHHVAPPGVLDVALELDAERAVVPAARQAAVDLARLEDEAAPLGEVHDLFHRHFGCHRRSAVCGRA